MKKILLILTFNIFISQGHSPAQGNEDIHHVVYLIGNTASADIKEENLVSLQKVLQNERNQFSIIHLGDILAPENIDNPKYTPDRLLNLLKGNSNGKTYYIPGEIDWDNGGRNGLKAVRKLEKQIEDFYQGTDILLPSKGCPGPAVIDCSPHLRIIAINTQWWLHPYDKPEAPDTDCSNLTREEVIESLEKLIQESNGKNILIIGHNPVVSAGIYGGHLTIKEHLFPFPGAKHGKWIPLPLFGSFYAAYRQNVGTPKDMANKDYQEFIDEMSGIMSKNPGLIYASAHDYNLQLLNFEEGYQVISGSINEKRKSGKEKGLLFSSAEYGFTKIQYFNSGKIEIRFYATGTNGPVELYSKILFRSACDNEGEASIPLNNNFIPCLNEKEIDNNPIQESMADSVIKKAGNYDAGYIKRLFLGSLYRTTWSIPVKVPVLNPDTVKGGLKPFAVGGGRQTTTLKFLANDGKEYAFRSVDKDLTKALPEEFRNTFVAKIVKQATATGYPYGGLVVSSLLDETDILHAKPELYVLPDHPGLGAFREQYKGLFGMLEERPKDPNEKTSGFCDADDVTRSMGLFRKLYKDNDKRVDARAFGEARVFDIFIGDFGRHEDNWKWAGYNVGNKRTYYPIPRDRDHAFSRWNGVLPYLADRKWGIQMIENFDYDFHDIKSLTWAARHVDRLLLTELDRNDWRDISINLQQTMSDEVIDRAISTLPPEVIPVSGTEIGDKLKSRRGQLPDAIDKYYLLLAKEVDVVGSNKHEYFDLERLETGNVQLDMYKRNKEGKIYYDNPLLSREFVRSETKEIRLYGLGGEDIFHIHGTANKSIKVRVIGGPGKDEIIDHSSVRHPGKHTIIYDTKPTDLKSAAESKSKISNDPGINKYDRESFMYNTYLPKPLIFYSSDDGFVASLGINWTTHGFRKEEYKGNYEVYARGGTYGNVQSGIKTNWKEVIGKWGAGIDIDYGHYYPYYNFFGLGNNSVKDPALFSAGYYKINVKGLMTSLYTEREFVKNTKFKLGLLFENLNSASASDTLLLNQGNKIPGSEMIRLGGINTSLSLDFRDRRVFATRGLQFLAENTSYLTLSGASGNFGMTNSYLKYYLTKDLLLPVTVVVKVGGSKNYGHHIPFYKYTFLGQYNNLRGFRRNRFTGDASAYLNSELRLNLGKVENTFIPFEIGITGLYDQGKVWYEGKSEGKWHKGYGMGLYISPLSRDYLLNVQFESSSEENLLIRFGIGFYLDD